MNSLNHYAYGSIGNWLYTKLAGLEMEEPGYKTFRVSPQFIKGITRVELEYESVYGKIALAWRCENGQIAVDLTVPANTTAFLKLPEKAETLTLGSGSYHYEYATETRLEQERYSLETALHTVLEHPAARETAPAANRPAGGTPRSPWESGRRRSDSAGGPGRAESRGT